MTCFLLVTHWIYNPIDRLAPWFAMSIFDDFRFLLKKRIQKRLLSCLMISNSILKRGFRLLPGNSGIKQKWQAITSRQWPSQRDHLCFCFLWFYLFSHLKHFCMITFLFLLSSIRVFIFPFSFPFLPFTAHQINHVAVVLANHSIERTAKFLSFNSRKATSWTT